MTTFTEKERVFIQDSLTYGAERAKDAYSVEQYGVLKSKHSELPDTPKTQKYLSDLNRASCKSFYQDVTEKLKSLCKEINGRKRVNEADVVTGEDE